jgi:hypothetical protein
MTDPKARSPEQPDSEPAPADQLAPDDAVRVRETLGAGLRKFYDSVLDEPIPDDWLGIVGEKSEEDDT